MNHSAGAPLSLPALESGLKVTGEGHDGLFPGVGNFSAAVRKHSC